MGRILIVEDSHFVRELLGRVLVRLGHEVVEAANGLEALECLKHESIDLILLDICMPKMSGYEVLEIRKDDAKLLAIPVIVTSALEEIESVTRCIELGADDYLIKPYDPILLKARIRGSLEKKSFHDKEVAYQKQLESEKARVEELLRVILPEPILEEFKKKKKVLPKLYNNVGILFCDVVDFTKFCDQHTPQEVVSALQKLVGAFEEIALKHHIQKIKTNGDSFICASGLMSVSPNPVLDCVRCGLEMIDVIPSLNLNWEVRVGVHVGPTMAGIVGVRQYLFDVWGDTVNIAARFAEQGSIGTVTLSHEAVELISDQYNFLSIGRFPVKGKGNMELFRITTPK